MFSTEDTIVAIATPLGRSGIGIVRLSGEDASRIANGLLGRERPLEPRHATFAKFRGSRIPAFRGPGLTDHVIATHFPAPHSYTGEDIVEISAHGSPVVLAAILRAAIDAGARLAEPGEFTLRAYLHGKLDLIQAEAVADLVDAVTPVQARAAFDQLEGTLTTAIGVIEAELFDLIARLEASLDFPEEGYHFVQPANVIDEVTRVVDRIDRLLAQSARGRLLREGAQIALLGTPNVGKSSLFNALLSTNRAIVTAIPGTTRDLLTERADINGVSVALIDTAGIRETSDEVEQEGVARARGAGTVASVAIVIVDRSRELTTDDRSLLEETRSRRRVVAINKIDLPAAWTPDDLDVPDAVSISARTRDGLDALIVRVAAVMGAGTETRDEPLVTNVRHAALLQSARDALTRATDALRTSEGKLPEEFLLTDLQDAAGHLQEITGQRSSDDLLRHIFERFCIGK